MRPFIEAISEATESFVICYPNAGTKGFFIFETFDIFIPLSSFSFTGLPNTFGGYDQEPEETGRYIRDFAQSGFVNIVGGCCGTTPEHIKAIKEAVKDVLPRKRRLNKDADNLLLSGLEATVVTKETNFVNIGERCNVAGSKKFARLIKENKYDVSFRIKV